MHKYGGDTVVEWMLWICDVAWKQFWLPEDWRKAIIVLIGDYSNIYKGMTLLIGPERILWKDFKWEITKINVSAE